MQSCKFCAIGDGAVGKTALLVSYSSNAIPTEYSPTVFDNYNAVTMYKDEPISLNLWDSAGQEDYDHLRPLSYSQTDCFLLCFSVTSPTSYSNIISKWLPELKKHCPDVPILLIGTKIDLRNDKNYLNDMKQRNIEMITTEQGNKLAQDIGAIDYIECSAITQVNLKLVFDRALQGWEQYRLQQRKKGKKVSCCNIM